MQAYKYMNVSIYTVYAYAKNNNNNQTTNWNTHTIQERVYSSDSNNALRYVAESVSPKKCATPGLGSRNGGLSAQQRW